jgi:poly(A)-specific ribonuclease
MDVNIGSFPSELVKIIQHIADSRFIAFDLEFSGVASRRAGGGANRLTLQEYYSDLRAAAQIYQILQVGLTIVTEDTEKGMCPDNERGMRDCIVPTRLHESLAQGSLVIGIAMYSSCPEMRSVEERIDLNRLLRGSTLQFPSESTTGNKRISLCASMVLQQWRQASSISNLSVSC